MKIKRFSKSNANHFTDREEDNIRIQFLVCFVKLEAFEKIHMSYCANTTEHTTSS